MIPRRFSDPSAVEIAKLRLWLPLVVDEEDIKQIKPLLNLDYKVVAANSLLGVEKNLFNTNLFNRLEEVKPLYFNETHKNKKDAYKNTPPIMEKIEHQRYKLNDFITGYQGEINVSSKKEYFTTKAQSLKYLPLVRGNQIKRYSIVDFPLEYCPVRVQSRDHYEEERVVFQEVANAGLDRRMNGTLMKNVCSGNFGNPLAMGNAFSLC